MSGVERSGAAVELATRRHGRERSGSPLTRIPAPALRAAAERAAHAFREEDASALDHEEALGELVELARAVHAGRVPERRSGSPVRAAARKRLLELLRAEVVNGWSGAESGNHPSRSTVLRILRSFERIRESLEREEADGALSPLVGAAGLELTVELAHDLRSPLTSILFLAEALQRGGGDADDVRSRELRIIYSAALEVVSVANDIINLARGCEGMDGEDRSRFSLGDVLDGVRDIVLPMADEQGIDVRCELPAADHRLGHAAPLRRALLNLTTNAIKSTEHGYVELGARPTGPGRVEFWVLDTGRGIDPEEQHRLYQPFRTSGQPSGGRFSSAGLGLAICRKLVQAMGGELDFETRRGHGTRFRFEIELPAAQPF